VNLTPAQVRTLRRARDGTLRPSRSLNVEGALIKKGLLTTATYGFRPTRAGWEVELPTAHFVMIDGREREVEARDGGWFLRGVSGFPLSLRHLAGALGIPVESVERVEGGVVLRGVSVSER
jgi:hypothetical protein